MADKSRSSIFERTPVAQGRPRGNGLRNATRRLTQATGSSPYLRQNFCYKNSSGHQDTDPAPQFEQPGLAQYLDGSEIVARRSELADMTYCCLFLQRLLVLCLSCSLRRSGLGRQSRTIRRRSRVIGWPSSSAIPTTRARASRTWRMRPMMPEALRKSEAAELRRVAGDRVSAEGFARPFSDADAKLGTASAVLIFYAGHGVQLQGQTTCCPSTRRTPRASRA